VDVAAPCALEPAFPKELPGLSPHAAVSPNPKIEAPTGDYVTAVQPCLPGGLVSGGRIAVPSRVPRHLPWWWRALENYRQQFTLENRRNCRGSQWSRA